MPYNNSEIKGWVRVVIIIVAYIFVGGVFNSIGKLIAEIDILTPIQETTDFQRLVITFFDFIAISSVILLLVKVVDDESLKEIGFKLKGRVQEIALGVILGLFIISLGFGILAYFKQIEVNRIHFNFENFICIFFLFAVISLKEEILLRGYILRNFMYSFNKYIALILSSLLFSIMHGLNPHFDLQAFLNLFLAGILLGLPYTFNKNLWFPIALHFSWNFFQSLFGFNVSGVDSYSLIEFSIPENNLINGGAFGFEGSILSIIFQLMAILVLFLYYTNLTIK